MNEHFRALITALSNDAQFREAFLNAPDRATRLQLAADAGLDVPTEAEVESHLAAAGMGGDQAAAESATPDAPSAMIINAMIIWGAME